MRSIATLGLGLFVTACAAGPGLDSQSQAVTVATALPDQVSDVQTTRFTSYRMGPTDTISVSVFNAPELAREGQVDGAGNFLLPLVGNVEAGGKTPAELASVIEDSLRGRYLKNPQVTVTIVEARAHTVTVDGAVTRPGIYPIAGEMTLQRAIATAQGLSEIADTDRVIVFRTVSGQKMAAMFDLNDIRSGRTEDPRIFGDDIVVVGESGVRRFLRDVSRVPALSTFIPVL